MTVRALYCIEWTEYERGWGQRPDGETYYATKEAAEAAYKEAFEGRTGSAPDYYVNPSKPKLVEVDEELYEKIMKRDLKEKIANNG